MPSRVKLLDNAGGGVTGLTIKLGMGPPPYTIRVFGAGGGGVSVEFAGDDLNWMRAIGDVGGEGFTELATSPQELVGLVDKTVALIHHYCKYMRAVSSGSMSGGATVYCEMER